jgi:transposase-like protein
MNLREQKYLTGSSDLDRIVFARRGRKVVVLDRIKRRKQAIRVMLDAGYRARDIARVLSCSEDLVRRERKNRNISDLILLRS